MSDAESRRLVATSSVSIAASAQTPGSAGIPVYLNVYDMAPQINEYTYWMGLGIYHSGIEVLGKEYSFGGHAYDFTGVIMVVPKNAPQVLFRESIFLGNVLMTEAEIRQVIFEFSEEWIGTSYSILKRNCNHFAYCLAHRLIGKGIPGWVNRAATIGTWVPCVLPKAWKELPEPQDQVVPRPPPGPLDMTWMCANCNEVSVVTPLSGSTNNIGHMHPYDDDTDEAYSSAYLSQTAGFFSGENSAMQSHNSSAQRVYQGTALDLEDVIVETRTR